MCPSVMKIGIQSDYSACELVASRNHRSFYNVFLIDQNIVYTLLYLEIGVVTRPTARACYLMHTHCQITI